MDDTEEVVDEEILDPDLGDDLTFLDDEDNDDPDKDK